MDIYDPNKNQVEVLMHKEHKDNVSDVPVCNNINNQLDATITFY